MSDYENPTNQDASVELMLQTAQNILYVEELRVAKEKFLHAATVIGRAVGMGLFDGLRYSSGLPITFPENNSEPSE